jgi:hypothetical protein
MSSDAIRSDSNASAGEQEIECESNNVSSSAKCTNITHFPAVYRYLQRYRQFIKQHRFILRLAEDGLCRLVLYAPGRFVAHSENSGHEKKKILPETLYALIHLWSLFNDTVYHGFGDGNGFTIGGLDEEGDRIGVSIQCVRVLRTILSIVECMAPSLEVSAYSKSILHQTTPRRGQDNDNFNSHHQRHMNALAISAKIERLKCVCRMGLVAINYYKQTRNAPSISCSTNPVAIVSNIGILQEGGLLNPDEHVTSQLLENERVQKLLYVGKRTGRKVGYQHYQNQFNNLRFLHNEELPQNHRGKSMLKSPAAKLSFLALGELLHIYRPLYYVKSCLRHTSIDDKDTRTRMYKSWILSLCMDVLSHNLTKFATTVQRGNVKIDVSSDSTKEELYHRKLKWALYLLRVPIWDMTTYPIAGKMAAIIGNYVPLIGKPLVQYIMDILCYWQRWHFMQES